MSAGQAPCSSFAQFTFSQLRFLALHAAEKLLHLAAPQAKRPSRLSFHNKEKAVTWRDAQLLLPARGQRHLSQTSINGGPKKQKFKANEETGLVRRPL